MNTGRATTGVAFVAIGGLVLLDHADVLDAGEVISAWWPLLFIIAGGLALLARPPRPVAATAGVAVGLVLLSITSGVVGVGVWGVLWSAALIAVGLWLLARPSVFDRSTGVVSDGRLDATAVLAGRRVAVTSTTFTGGRATAVLGSVELDLTGAHIEGEAALDVVAVLGGIDVRVPSEWRVVLDGPVLLGACESHIPTPPDPEAPTLRVLGTAVLGGIEVTASAGVSPSVRLPA